MGRRRKARTPKPRKPRTPDELRRASVHLRYELHMLVDLALSLARHPKQESPDDLLRRRAFVEAFAIHARNVHHFLWPVAEKPEDVLACDYFAGPWSEPAKPDALPAFANFRGDVGTAIAHLSYKRPDPGGEKDWDELAIAHKLASSIVDFEAQVDESLLDDRWRDPKHRVSANVQVLHILLSARHTLDVGVPTGISYGGTNGGSP